MTSKGEHVFDGIPHAASHVPAEERLQNRVADELTQRSDANTDRCSGTMQFRDSVAALSAPDETRRITLSRRTTRESVARTSSYQRPTPQLLSSLMVESSNSSNSNSSNSKDFNLRPPALKPKPPSVELMSEMLFSSGHLRTILQHPSLLARLTSFMHRYQPKEYPLLIRYVENAKAMAAVEYANAIAASTADPASTAGSSRLVAKLDDRFESLHQSDFESLVSSALPLYITYSLVKVVSECLENEITGKTNPVMRNLIGGLSEVFCLTDPNQEDNPIVFASQEFYRLTGYDRDHVIGHNCRFLQGARTNRESPIRIKASLDQGDEIHETMLNYRNDGRPFINLLMLAPLHDDNGKVKYHIGAQVDVTGLVEGGRAIESFQRFLAQRDTCSQQDEWAKYAGSPVRHPKRQEALDKLKGLSELLDQEESAIVQSSSRHGSVERRADRSELDASQAEGTDFPQIGPDLYDQELSATRSHENNIWDISKAGPHGISGQLPGVYEKYMLIRPVPSLRIIFASSRLQTWGKFVQHPFMSHIAADQATLSGLNQCFAMGAPVTTKVKFMLHRGDNRHGTTIQLGTTDENVKQSKSCWISATPLFDSDDRLGVWMVVFVERLKGSDRAERQGVFGRNISQPERNEMSRRMLRRQSYHRSLSNDLPIKPKRIDGNDVQSGDLAAIVHRPAMVPTEPKQSESKASTLRKQRTSPSPAANSSRRASPRRPSASRQSSSPSPRFNRRRLVANSDEEESDKEP